jgi:hypothetical protein
MIETGIVYIYSSSPARHFVGCGALLEGGYVATCRHVWRIAAPTGQPPNEPPEVEIVFPFARDRGVSTRRAGLADACEEPDGAAPDLVLLKPDTIPSGAMSLQLATKAHAGLIGRDKANPSRVSEVRVRGEIIDFMDAGGAASV